MIERFLRVTPHLGIEDDGDRMELPVEPAAALQVDERLAAAGIGSGDRVLTLIGGASFGAAKMWPPESFARAAALMAARHGTRAAIAPGPGEERIGEVVARLSVGAVTVLEDPPLALAENAALLTVPLAISNDTGPRSMAVALGLPVSCRSGRRRTDTRPPSRAPEGAHRGRGLPALQATDLPHRSPLHDARITAERVVGAAESFSPPWAKGPWTTRAPHAGARGREPAGPVARASAMETGPPTLGIGPRQSVPSRPRARWRGEAARSGVVRVAVDSSASSRCRPGHGSST